MTVKIPEKDLEFIQTQKPSVVKLWLQCWCCDPYGYSWKILNYDMSYSAFKKAKRILWDAGLFAFRPDRLPSDCRRTVGYKVLNLHGSRSAKKNSYWLKYIEDIELDQDLGETDQVS